MAAPRPRARGRAWILGPGLALALGIGLAAAAPSQDQESRKREELQRVEDELKASHERHEQLDRDAKDLAHELDDLRGRLVIAGRSTRDNEAALSALETTLAKLEKEAAAKTALLALHREELGALLGALQRLAIHPPEAMLALPQPPRDTVRSAMLLEATLPRVDAQVKELKGELDDLARVQRDVAHQRAMVQSAVGHLSDQRRSLDRLLQRKAALERRTVAEADRTGQRTEQLASTARDLKDLIDKLVQEREAEQARHAQEAKRADEARQLEALRRSGAGTAVAELTPGAGRTLPAAGRILSTYGTQTDFGPSAQGITIETRPDAVVVAPWAGRVMFAGPFRGYGQILIIEHADGYHSLIAGLGHIDTDVGRSLATGEPVGSMGRPPDRNPTLYFELRHHGQPVNPQPWLAAEQVR
ncbi:MAG TPA: peptidoglycan DD-metalloendopeptidase family protein [Candidatus Sulfotelmatobacter sp.]|nr:peptidoglycan DD-metalloendopeptidase family protein [Candidatus Sulfotelmatobacter sp.]